MSDTEQFILDNWDLLDENQQKMAEMIGLKKKEDDKNEVQKNNLLRP